MIQTYVDEIYAYMDEYDGWNADGSLDRDYNRVPFSDYSKTDSAGNTWTPYIPKNTPYEVSNWSGDTGRKQAPLGQLFPPQGSDCYFAYLASCGTAWAGLFSNWVPLPDLDVVVLGATRSIHCAY